MVRTTILMAFVIALLIAIPQPRSAMSQTTSSDVAQKTQEALATIKAYLVEKKNEAVQHGKELLEKTDAEIEELQAKAAKTSADTKTSYKEEIEKLKQKRAAAAKKLDELGSATAASWDSAKEGFAEAYTDLYDAYREALAKFK